MTRWCISEVKNQLNFVQILDFFVIITRTFSFAVTVSDVPSTATSESLGVYYSPLCNGIQNLGSTDRSVADSPLIGQGKGSTYSAKELWTSLYLQHISHVKKESCDSHVFVLNETNLKLRTYKWYTPVLPSVTATNSPGSVTITTKSSHFPGCVNDTNLKHCQKNRDIHNYV